MEDSWRELGLEEIKESPEATMAIVERRID